MLTAVAIVLAGASCTSGDILAADEDVRDPCDWLHSAAPAPLSQAQDVFMIDVSSSARPKEASGTGPDYAAVLAAEMDAAIVRGDAVSIGTFDGSTATSQWIVSRQVTDRGRDNPANRTEDARDAKECLRAALKRAAATPPQSPGSDPVGALATAAHSFAGVTGPRRVFVATDGLATTGCVDLQRVRVGGKRLLAEIVALCNRSRPSSLAGAEVTFVGIGHPASGHPQPPSDGVGWLGSLWGQVCSMTQAAVCTVSTGPVRLRTGSAEDTVTVADPPVSFRPATRGVAVNPPETTTYRLDSDVLFDHNSYRIRPEGRTELTRLADRIKAKPQSTVAVDGYTQADSTPDANRWLAQHRADAVGRELSRATGRPVIATGHPGTAPNCPPQTRNGQADEAARQCNRRVDVSVTAPAT